MAWSIGILEEFEIGAFWLRGDDVEAFSEFSEETGGIFWGDEDADVEAHAVEGLGLFRHFSD